MRSVKRALWEEWKHTLQNDLHVPIADKRQNSRFCRHLHTLRMLRNLAEVQQEALVDDGNWEAGGKNENIRTGVRARGGKGGGGGGESIEPQKKMEKEMVILTDPRSRARSPP